MANKLINIKGMKFGKLTVLNYIGNKQWNCLCDCGKNTTASSTQLRNGTRISCGCERGKRIALEGKQIGLLEVLEWCTDGSKRYLCKCNKGHEFKVFGQSLREGRIPECKECALEKKKARETEYKEEKERREEDHTGETVWEWTILKRITNKQYDCRCSCGKHSIKYYSELESGRAKSCGHSLIGPKSLIGNIINKLRIEEKVGSDLYRCKCECGKTRVVRGYYLRRNHITDCGCVAYGKRKETLIENYGEVVANKQGSERTLQQIDIIQSKEDMEKAITEQFTGGAYTHELCSLFGITKSMVLRYIHRYKLEHLVKYGGSKFEEEVYNFVVSICKDKIIRQNKTILNNMELDIYIPSRKIAIECNGNYWHSTLYKETDYHQKKTIDCAKIGIQLIHIFEYEWINDITRNKIFNLLTLLLNDAENNQSIAKEYEIITLGKSQATLFENEYSLQDKREADEAYGLQIENELAALMAFKKQTTTLDWELVNYCTSIKNEYIDTFEKLITHFIEKNKLTSITAYINIAKFNGSEYVKNGFKANIEDISVPNYKWVMKAAVNNKDSNRVLNSSQTDIRKLILEGLGKYGDTEDEIMGNLGFIKIYDSGYLKLKWIK